MRSGSGGYLQIMSITSAPARATTGGEAGAYSSADGPPRLPPDQAEGPGKPGAVGDGEVSGVVDDSRQPSPPRPVAAGERLEFGVHRLPPGEAKAAPASRPETDAGREAAYRRDLERFRRSLSPMERARLQDQEGMG